MLSGHKLRKSIAWTKGFGRSEHERLVRAFGVFAVLGFAMYEHTPRAARIRIAGEAELSVLTNDERIYDLIVTARQIVS
jgi:hypothetical protein